MTLRDLIARLSELDDSLTIYAERDPEWTESSRAALAPADEPPDGMDYVLEVARAQEAVAAWSRGRKNMLPTLRERYEAVLYYALHGAFLPDD